MQQRLLDALAAKGPDYRPRTRHLTAEGQPIYTNRLILEDSPYLLQHAHNPVNWYPWGDEAFADAAEQNKPIFLSIGYATCHWCHVMEEQSFESTSVADILNEHYICIKVDREQYPDIDATYMTAVTLFSGHGGWPMSSFLCPNGEPFFGGTYFPKANFIDLLTRIEHAWAGERELVYQQAEQLADAVEHSASGTAQLEEINENLISSVVEIVLGNYDARHGGFSSAPKFPHEPLLLLILQVLERQPHSTLSAALEHTLAAMAQGGIYDQVGGGFHRYSVDQFWLVPHFEKMLYNQAYLTRSYLRAFILTGNPLHERVVRQTLDYVLREMRDQSGLFYSATDADSEGREGTYFVWTIDEIERLLPEDDAQFLVEIFGMTKGGNFEGNNILYLPQSLASVSRARQQSLEHLCQRLDGLLETLREYRRHRVPPLTDDKILVAWNGMLITALAEAGHHLNAAGYLQAAEKAANTLWQTQRTERQLWRVNLRGKASVAGKQEDYALLAEAFLTLYDFTGTDEYLARARLLTDEMLDRFLDASSGALQMGNERLLFTQPKDSYDGALPSGNAVAVRVLHRLYRRSGESAYRESARNILRYFAGRINAQPLAYAYMLAQLDELNHGEIGDCQYVAEGAIKITAELTQHEDNRVEARILFSSTDPDWRFNSEPDIAPTDSSTWSVNRVGNLETNDGGFEKRVQLSRSDGSWPDERLVLQLSVQPCDSLRCLPVEQTSLTLYPG